MPTRIELDALWDDLAQSISGLFDQIKRVAKEVPAVHPPMVILELYRANRPGSKAFGRSAKDRHIVSFGVDLDEGQLSRAGHPHEAVDRVRRDRYGASNAGLGVQGIGSRSVSYHVH